MDLTAKDDKVRWVFTPISMGTPYDEEVRDQYALCYTAQQPYKCNELGVRGPREDSTHPLHLIMECIDDVVTEHDFTRGFARNNGEEQKYWRSLVLE